MTMPWRCPYTTLMRRAGYGNGRKARRARHRLKHGPIRINGQRYAYSDVSITIDGIEMGGVRSISWSSADASTSPAEPEGWYWVPPPS